jgi:hypothetical protein
MSNPDKFPHPHPHPHIDPTFPQTGSVQKTNPPVFVWNPVRAKDLMHLVIARDPALEERIYDIIELLDPMYLPEISFPPGEYYWRWSDSVNHSPIYFFEISVEAVILEIPAIESWLQRFPSNHPRIFTRPEDIPALRKACETGVKSNWPELNTVADQLLKTDHAMDPPPFLSDRKADYKAWFKVWYEIMWGSRKFVHGANTLALAYLASGDLRYGQAAASRMVSISKWDPESSSFLGYNDEAHMSVIWHGPQACDWVWDLFTDEERKLVIEQYRDRGRITFDHMRNKGYYGITRFDSHAGREIVFLALIAFVFHDHIPEAKSWLTWLRPILCGVWPIWGQDDGGWAEGMSYSTAYVDIMTMFATALKRGADIDMFQRPFWRNHAVWRQYCWPPYAEWIGFGDHSERWKSAWTRNADLVDLIGRETETDAFNEYIHAFREEAKLSYTPPERDMPGISAQLFLQKNLTTGQTLQSTSSQTSKPVFQLFSDIGWAVLRTDLYHPDRDIAFIFRSSPYGAISHSHANNNDFIIHAGGKVLAMPSGYYAGYGSDHHAHWVWHTKSHNCITLSGAPQIMRSHNSRGSVDHVFEDDRLLYFRGVADESYSDRAIRCRRHVCYLKQHASFLMVDEYLGRPDVVSALQWNIHSWAKWDVDEINRSFHVNRQERSLTGHILYSHNGYFSLSEGWDPPPSSAKSSEQWHQQYHLRFTPTGVESVLNLGVLLCPALENQTPPPIRRDLTNDVEAAFIGADSMYIRQKDKIELDHISTEALILLNLAGQIYHVDDRGVR